MHWPYVSRRAYDLLVDERDRLRARNDELTDHLVRLARTTNGLRELKVEQSKPDPMPQEVQDMVMAWGSGATRSDVLGRIWKMHREHTAGGMAPVPPPSSQGSGHALRRGCV